MGKEEKRTFERSHSSKFATTPLVVTLNKNTTSSVKVMPKHYKSDVNDRVHL